MKTKTLILAMIFLFASLCATEILHSGMDDKSDRLSASQSSVFSPGYINAAKQKADSIISQVNGNKKRFNDNAQDNLTENIGRDVTNVSRDMVTPELKKKTEGSAYAGQPNKTVSADLSIAKISDKQMEDVRQKGVVETTLNNGNSVKIWVEGEKSYFNIKDKNGAALVQKQEVRADDGLKKSFVSAIEDLGQGKFAVKMTSYDYSITGDIYKYDATQGVRVYSSRGEIERQEQCRSYDYQNLSTNKRTYEFNAINNITSADLNRDGIVDIADLGAMAQNWKTNNATYSKGDINGDGFVNEKDLKLLNDSWQKRSAESVKVNIASSNPLGIDTFSAAAAPYINNQLIINPVREGPGGVVPAVRLNYSAAPEPGKSSLAAGSKSILGDPVNVKSSDAKGTMDLSGGWERALISKDALAVYSLISVKDRGSDDQIGLSALLSNILKNPTEAQKNMIDSVEALLKVVDEMDKETGSPDLKKTGNDLLQTVAAILIAQAIPDLLKEGDVSNIKNIFQDLNNSKTSIMAGYDEATKPYYNEMKNLLSKNMMAKEVDELRPSEIDKILEKLRNASNKSFAEEYILQQEVKYRKQYIDPNKKMLEYKMKDAMKNFTQRLSLVLENAKPVKK